MLCKTFLLHYSYYVEELHAKQNKFASDISPVLLSRKNCAQVKSKAKKSGFQTLKIKSSGMNSFINGYNF